MINGKIPHFTDFLKRAFGIAPKTPARVRRRRPVVHWPLPRAMVEDAEDDGGWGADQCFGKEGIMKAFWRFLKFDKSVNLLLLTPKKRLELKEALIRGMGVWVWATTPKMLAQWLDRYPGQLGPLLEEYRTYTIEDGAQPHSVKSASELFQHGRLLGGVRIGDYKVGDIGRDDRHIARNFVNYVDKQIARFVTALEDRLEDFETTGAPPPKKRRAIDIATDQLALCNTTIEEQKNIIEAQANQIAVSAWLFRDRACDCGTNNSCLPSC